MPRRTRPPGPPAPVVERIDDIDVTREMQDSFLEYAYSVIYSRALPDARDGLKPVQRRILFQMAQMGLRPDRGHVKSARVVGDVMGRLHPHGDSAIYDALVRMAQPFSLRLPMIDGHGNFGSPDDGPAAMRYTECRLAAPAQDMTASLDEDVVDFTANYDGRETEPVVLPAAIPNLLVNGAAGIAVGMATNMAPHNLGEVVAAARHLLANPAADTAALMRFLPGPDLPTGGTIVGLEGIREAYETGRGSFKMRATTRIEQLTSRRQGIVITELPYNVGPERLVERVKHLVQGKKIAGIADLVDLTDGEHGLRLELQIKSGFNADAVLAQLLRSTPLEEQFSINNVALVDGQPRVLSLRELLQVFLDHRIEVVRRRSAFRLARADERLHLVDGLLIAILDIDEVIAVIRSSDDAGIARTRLMDVFDLSETQATYILDMPLRRLTRFSRIELEAERDTLQATIADLRAILADAARLRGLVSEELAAVAKRHGTPRRTVLLEAGGAVVGAEVPLEVSDDPCWVLLSATGLMARTSTAEPLPADGDRRKHDVLASAVRGTARGEVGLVTSDGQVHRMSVLELPTLPPSASRPVLSGGTPLAALVDLPRGVEPVGLVSLAHEGGFLLGTRAGVVKRVAHDAPAAKQTWECIRLAEGDAVIGAADLGGDAAWAVAITSDAQVLRFPVAALRAQGRAAGGVAGIKVNDGAEVLGWFAVPDGDDVVLATAAGSADALPGTDLVAVKLTPLSQYPAKGRGTGGVRCMRFTRGQHRLALAWAGRGPALGSGPNGVPVDLPAIDERRDGSGVIVTELLVAVGGR